MSHLPHAPVGPDAAILLTASPGDKPDVIAPGLSGILVPIHGKSLLQRAVEEVVRHGATRIHVVLGEDAPAIRALLAGGERWGCQFSYHYLDPARPSEVFPRSLDLEPTRDYRLCTAWCVPIAPEWPASADRSPICWKDGDQSVWTGWGRFSGAWLLARNQIAGSVAPPHVFDRRVDRFEPHWVEPPLSGMSPGDLLAAHRRLLAQSGGDEIRIGRGSRVHPEARLIAPCRLGRNVRIEAGAVIGPGAAIEDGALIDRGARVIGSLVTAETYVGPDVELEKSIAHGNLLVNVALDTAVEVEDPELLADISAPAAGEELAVRLLSAALSAALLPIYALAKWRLRHAPTASVPRAVLPKPRRCQTEPGHMTLAIDLAEPALAGRPNDHVAHFARTFFPGLRAIRLGKLRLVGPSLRSRAEVRQLPCDWRRIYAEVPCGLLNDTLLRASPSSDEQFASDALAARGGLTARDAVVQLKTYLGRVLRDLCRRPPGHALDMPPGGRMRFNRYSQPIRD